jgi:phage host-nuclease inhibitor protein Gam
MEAINPSINVFTPNIIESESGFLVGGDFASEPTEVLRSESGLHCQCLIAQATQDDCEHIRAVRDYVANSPMSLERPTLSQACADHYVTKLGELDIDEAANEASANEQTGRISLWFEMESEKIARKKAYYIQALDNFMTAKGYSTKHLVNGTLRVRSQQPEIKINNTETVLEDARFVRIIPEKRTIDKAALRKHCIQTGEEVPGTEIILKPHKFSYKLSGGV